MNCDDFMKRGFMLGQLSLLPVQIPGDGHCFFSSINESVVWRLLHLPHFNNGAQMRNYLCDLCLQHVRDNDVVGKVMCGMYENCFGLDESFNNISEFLLAAKTSSNIWGGDFFICFIILHFKICVVQAELRKPNGCSFQIWLSSSYILYHLSVC